MSLARNFRLFPSLFVIAGVTLGCGSDDNPERERGSADGAVADASSGSTSDASSGPSAGDGGASDAGGSSGGPGPSDAGGSAGGGNDASVIVDGSSSPSDAGSAQDASTTADAGSGARFSFFVTSEVAIRDLSKDPQGFGGDLRYGETGAGAGLRGADKICAAIAERSMPGAGAKPWRAFLSAAAGGEGGGAVNARDRIGAGPWYDRKGRLVGNALADLLSASRPSQADVQIRDDLPNETGTPNHAPDGTQVDNHDTLTGSDTAGRYVSGSNTCQDWTSTAASSGGGGGGGGGGGSGPSIGHSWPRSANMGMNWVSDHRAGGCAKGINTGGGSTDGTATVGSGGGYGGFYCFALVP